MINLLRANFSRLIKCRMFYLLCGLFFGLGAIIYALNAVNLRKFGEEFFVNMYNFYLFLPVVIIGAASAVFSAFYIGVDFQQGTVRNKLAVGMNKSKVYLANFLTVFLATCLIFLSYILAAAVIGIPFFGLRTFMGVSRPLVCVSEAACIIAAFSGVFTMISMFAQDKAAALLAGIVVFAVIFFAGMEVYSRLTAEEYVTYKEMGADGILQDVTKKNAKYLPSEERSGYEWAAGVLPVGAALEAIDPEPSAPEYKVLMGELGVAAAVTAVGAIGFGRKDVK